MTTTGMQILTMTINIGKTEFGTPSPRIEVRLPRGTAWRHAKAALHQLAAAVELGTSAHEQWSVQIVESSDFHRPGGRVQLELADGTETEATRGMALLEQIALLSRAPS